MEKTNGDQLNNPEGFVIDSAFYVPTNHQLNNAEGVVNNSAASRSGNPPNDGYEEIDREPALVDFGNQTEPSSGTQHNPNLQGGK
ncbi:unnamed protein product, partial [Iphiclides podalirius]